jgi:hypothetical protein
VSAPIFDTWNDKTQSYIVRATNVSEPKVVQRFLPSLREDGCRQLKYGGALARDQAKSVVTNLSPTFARREAMR